MNAVLYIEMNNDISHTHTHTESVSGENQKVKCVYQNSRLFTPPGGQILYYIFFFFSFFLFFSFLLMKNEKRARVCVCGLGGKRPSRSVYLFNCSIRPFIIAQLVETLFSFFIIAELSLI
jgi:hypothetical protein